jgi:hypothetical protein
MEEIGNDDIRTLFLDEWAEAFYFRKIKDVLEMKGLYPDILCEKLGSELPRVFESKNGVIEGIKEGEGSKKHIFTATITE